MALEKRVELGLVTILPDGRLQIRTDTVVVDDEKELMRTYHRVVLNPGDDATLYPQLIQDLAELLWTPEVVATWKASETSKVPPTGPRKNDVT